MKPVEELPWLRSKSDDFRDRVRELRSRMGEVQLGEIRQLVDFSLTSGDLFMISQLMDQVKKQNPIFGQHISHYRLGVVGSSTTQLLVPCLLGTGVRFDLEIEVVEAEFDQVLQEALDPTSEFAQAKLDAVLVLLDESFLQTECILGKSEEENRLVEENWQKIESAISGFNKNCGCPVIISNFVGPLIPILGSTESLVAGSSRRIIERINQLLEQLVFNTSNYLFDQDYIARLVGYDRWFNQTQWFTARLPFDQTFLPLVTDHICRILAAIKGKAKKVLVLDLDNTLWGGVVGDDGVDGIKVGEGDPCGEAHLALQKLSNQFRNRGVVLAIASKNEDHIARGPFRVVENMVLREDDFAVFQANWEDKASNIRMIAEILDLGLDSFVFVDDNPVERELVRSKIPEVAVPEMPSDPSQYARILGLAGYFETIGFTSDDRKRNQQYQANASRSVALNASSSLEDFLQSLEMKITIRPLNRSNLKRTVQLINKTNQFNLTTRRYTEKDVEDFLIDPQTHGFLSSVEDKFGDNGLICVVLVSEKDENKWLIDTWLMSCRVLRRGVEDAIMNHVLGFARDRGCIEMQSMYIPTKKNTMVANFYDQYGFSLLSSSPLGEKTYKIHLNSYENKKHFLEYIQ